MITARTAAAVKVFTDLGWASAGLADAETRPLGTPEQQRVARDGLASGDWGEWGFLEPEVWDWVRWVDADPDLLAVFAVRVGVDARRTARLLRDAHAIDDELATRLVEARGPDFAARFVAEGCRSVRRDGEHATSDHAGALVRLVDRCDLPVPEDVEYLRDWSVYALGVLTGGGELHPHDRGWCEPGVIERRLPEHVRAAVGAGVPGTGPFGSVVPAAVARGWLARDEAVDLVLAALDAAQRPGDRKVWAQVLTGPLGLTDDELVERADSLVPVLAHGDGPVISLLAPRLIAGVPEDVLRDVLAVTLPVRTTRVVRLLLTAAADRPRPRGDVVDAVTSLVAPHTASTDRALARAAEVLVQAWGMSARDVADEPVVTGLWRATPPVWDAPRFEAGTVSGAALTDAAAVLTGRPEGVVDVEVERFLALANAVAAQDREAARTALAGVRTSWVGGLRGVAAWVKGEQPEMLDSGATRHRRAVVWRPAEAREAAVMQRLGEVPVLLSTPTWVDLRIDPADLVERLTTYAAAGAVASEADLYLACTRADLALVTDEVRAGLDDLPVPVVLQDGTHATVTAGPTVRGYLDAPFREPALRLTTDADEWECPPLGVPPRALAPLPARHGTRDTSDMPGIETFPAWGDATRGLQQSADPDVGLLLRQHARRATPLTPGLAVNLVAAQRGFHPAAAADGVTAVHEAWERGLLRPGVADVALLDWARTPSNLAALARACGGLAAEGLLSVVWPLLDDVLLASLRAPRMLAGTAEVALTMRSLLPAVLDAVGCGDAVPTALDVPGVRALAGRSGSSNAVTAARAMVDLLPPEVPAATPVGNERARRSFDEVWAPGAGTRPAVDDGAGLTVRWEDPTAASRMLAVDVTLAHVPGEPYRVVKRSFYDLGNEGRCAALSAAGVAADPPGSGRADAWLHWDESAGRLVASPHRDRRGAQDAPLRTGDPLPPLTTSMVAVVLASLCHDCGSTYEQREIMGQGLFGSAAVTIAVRALVAQPDISPARMVRLLESDPTTLPVLWPVLVESVRHAAGVAGPPPRWLNRVLDVTLLHAPHLREAAGRGLLSDDAATWPGLAELAARPGESAVLRKARELVTRLAPVG
ncbi:DUF7824 domain-containing protein [Cellulomonas sp. URHB0016]